MLCMCNLAVLLIVSYFSAVEMEKEKKIKERESVCESVREEREKKEEVGIGRF